MVFTGKERDADTGLDFFEKQKKQETLGGKPPCDSGRRESGACPRLRRSLP
jgi:hypothetical protein